jgi:hypothetical protein
MLSPVSSVALLVIAKEPLPGRAKTRLTPPCSADQAAELARDRADRPRRRVSHDRGVEPVGTLVRPLTPRGTVNRCPFCKRGGSPRRSAAAEHNLACSTALHPTGSTDGLLDYRADIGAHLRALVFDLARRGGGSGGLIHAGQAEWLEAALAEAGERWILVVSHQPLIGSTRDRGALRPHPSQPDPRPSDAGRRSLADQHSVADRLTPQQSRALRVLGTAGGGVAIQTWMLDHVFPGRLGTISRQLAYLDAQGGRPQGFIGSRLDRKVTLYRSAVRA